MKKFLNLAFLVVLGIAVLFFSDKGIAAMKSLSNDKITVVIDAGHGGADPGKVGINGALEKDVNLQVALYLKELLTQNDIDVILTRETDTGLYEDGDKNKKTADLKRRVDIINAENVDFAVSIHQNSYISDGVRGAQVFYYKGSEEGKRFADIMQSSMINTLQDGNTRVAKADSSYYLLKNSDCPLIIVECGFLSDSKEAELLIQEEYQRRLAWALHLGILEYLKQM